MTAITALLEYWMKLELLHPYEIKNNGKSLHVGMGGGTPWIHSELLCLASNEKIAGFTIYLGVFPLSLAQGVLNSIFGNKEKNPNVAYEQKKKKTCLCKLRLDVSGHYIENSLQCSSMPWAIGMLAKNKFNDVGTKEFREFVEATSELLTLNTENIISIDQLRDFMMTIACLAGLNSVSYGIEKIYNALDISVELNTTSKENTVKKSTSEETQSTETTLHQTGQEKVSLATRTDMQPSEDEDSGEVDTELEDDEAIPLLNSYYLADLERVKTTKEGIGKALSVYMGAAFNPTENWVDIGKDLSALQNALSPRWLCTGRWLSAPDKPLQLMQQAAVNLIYENLGDASGIYSVNGPPGTGKTTLLSDIIAAVVVKRAEVLESYEDPKQAFLPTQTCVITVKNKTFENKIHPLKDEFQQFGIVVASSNNGAVENITKELPELKKIEYFEGRPDSKHFREIAQHVYKKSEVWGFISYALGKKANRREFAESFWRLYKKKSENGKAEAAFNVTVLSGRSASMGQWEQARKAFAAAKDEVNRKVMQLESWQKALESLPSFKEQFQKGNRQMESLTKEIAKAQGVINLADETLKEVVSRVSKAEQAVRYLDARKRWWHRDALSWLPFVRIFLDQYHTAYSILQGTQEEKRSAEKELNSKKQKYGELTQTKSQLDEKIKQLSAKIKSVELIIDEARRTLGSNFPVPEFWAKGTGNKDQRSEFQKSSPWVYKELSEARSILFLKALALHRAFIESNKQNMRDNLNLFIRYIYGQIPFNLVKQHLPMLWNTFFMVVPVVSSTFASFSSMFQGMGRESIGWLLIDEAGQAVPQAAVGAIWRSKRVVVVGDPFQIEPVVTTPDSNIEDLRKFYDIPLEVASKVCSVQTIADKANRYGTDLNGRRIGSPLFVHRRCLRNMFDISNNIAYAKKMVYGTTGRDEKGDPLLLDKDYWIDVKGEISGKHWVPEQGEVVKSLIRNSIRIHQALPRVYIISPFTEVKDRLKDTINELQREFPAHILRDFHKWKTESIGTVHTFQGKEQETVIFCLGLDKSKIRAAEWASQTPNILNVAVTRAKYRLLIIGDYNLWSPLDNFEVAAQILQRVSWEQVKHNLEGQSLCLP